MYLSYTFSVRELNTNSGLLSAGAKCTTSISAPAEKKCGAEVAIFDSVVDGMTSVLQSWSTENTQRCLTLHWKRSGVHPEASLYSTCTVQQNVNFVHFAVERPDIPKLSTKTSPHGVARVFVSPFINVDIAWWPRHALYYNLHTARPTQPQRGKTI